MTDEHTLLGQSVASSWNAEQREFRVRLDGVDAAEVEGDALRLFGRRGPFGLFRHTRSYHPPNDRWHHVELHRDRTAVVVLRED